MGPILLNGKARIMLYYSRQSVSFDVMWYAIYKEQ